MSDSVQPYLRRIPQFADLTPSDYQTERLGGLTNRVYRVKVRDQDYLLRIPGAGTEDYINRAVEAHDATVAAATGVSAQVLFFDESDGLMLAKYIPGLTLSAEGFKDLDRVRRAARSFKQLHQSGQAFKTRFDVFEKIDDYLALVTKLNAPVPDGYQHVKQEADVVRQVLAANPAPLAPCHCDPLAENFIDTGEQVYIVDWEYAGNNDPMWDLGDLSVEAGFDSEQDKALLESYFGGAIPPDQLGRMVMYKALCDLLWTLWGVVQHANDNPAEDFWAYSVNRFERCQALMVQPDFKQHLQAIIPASAKYSATS